MRSYRHGSEGCGSHHLEVPDLCSLCHTDTTLLNYPEYQHTNMYTFVNNFISATSFKTLSWIPRVSMAVVLVGVCRKSHYFFKLITWLHKKLQYVERLSHSQINPIQSWFNRRKKMFGLHNKLGSDRHDFPCFKFIRIPFEFEPMHL